MPAQNAQSKMGDKAMEMLGLFGILGYFSFRDMKERQIGLVPLVLSAIVGLVFHLWYGRISIWNLLGGICIGLCLYVVSVISHEKIGKGDALLLAVTGIFLGFWDNLILLWIASLLAAVAGGMAMVFFHKERHFELPFIPCIFIGFVMYLSMQHMGGLS